MRLLAREITLVVVSEFGPDEMLRRLSDPTWFQAFGCVLGFDWHSSGVTTTVCGALKDGLAGMEHESGLVFAGGKGGTSRKTPAELRTTLTGCAYADQSPAASPAFDEARDLGHGWVMVPGPTRLYLRRSTPADP
jgi:hypothetical protein